MARRILLVDDDPLILETAGDILEDAGYALGTAGSLADALRQLNVCLPDLILADLNLPDGTGVELARQVRQITPSIPFFLLTGQAPDDGKLPDGVTRYLLKPIEPRALMAAIDGALAV